MIIQWGIPRGDQLRYLIENPKDISLIEKLPEMSYEESLFLSVLYSDDKTVGLLEEGNPIAMFGVIPLEDRIGQTWTSYSRDVDDHTIGFFRKSKEVFNTWKEEYDELRTTTMSMDSGVHRWLSYLGLTPSGRGDFIWRKSCAD